MSNDYGFAELADLERDERDALLDSAVSMFLAHNVCFRETDPHNKRVYLVFPDLINLKRPAVENEHPVEDGAAYRVSGAIENVYASLVVLLGYTSVFARTNQWHDQAQYVFGDDGICGFKVDDRQGGRLDLVLYFGTNVEPRVRGIFQDLFESFLERPGLEVRAYPVVICPNRHPVISAVVRQRIDKGKTSVFCDECGVEVALDDARVPTDRAAVEREQRITDERREVEGKLHLVDKFVQKRALARPTCFISYAWGVLEQERWVAVLVDDLIKAGVRVIFDEDDAPIGTGIARFVELVESADRVIVVGTPDYRRKYDNKDPMRGTVTAAEGELICARMLGTEAEKMAILPVLLKGDKTSFPPLLQARVHADFRQADEYFKTLLALVRSLYAIPSRDPELRELLSFDSGA